MAAQSEISISNFNTHFVDSVSVGHVDPMIADTIVVTQKEAAQKFLTTDKTEAVRFQPQPIIVQHYEWQMITLSLSILLIAYVRITGKNFFKHLQAGLVSRPIFRQLFRDGVLFPKGASLPLFLANLLIVTTLLYQVITQLVPNGLFVEKPFWKQLSEIIFLFVIYSISQYLAVSILGFIFKTKGIVKEYRSNTLFYNALVTIALTPILIFSIYSSTNIILWTAVAIAVILLLFRLYRGLLIAFELSNYSLYQIILYLCALEILPILVLVKILIR